MPGSLEVYKSSHNFSMDKFRHNLGFCREAKSCSLSSDSCPSPVPSCPSIPSSSKSSESHFSCRPFREGGTFPSLYSSQTRGESSPNNKFEAPEPFDKVSFFQNDLNRSHKTFASPRSMVNLSRFERGVSAHTDTERLPEISGLPVERSSMDFHFNAFWSLRCPQSVHFDYETSPQPSPQSRCTSNGLPGRLFSLGRHPGTVPTIYRSSGDHFEKFRFCNQLSKEQSNTFSISPMAGFTLGDSSKLSMSYPRLPEKDNQEDKALPKSYLCIKERNRISHRNSEFCHPGIAMGSVSSESYYSLDESLYKGSLSGFESPFAGSEAPSFVVGLQTESERFCSPCRPPPSTSDYNGFLHHRMGSLFRGSTFPRNLESRREEFSHKFLGAPSSVQRSSHEKGEIIKFQNFSLHRQHYRCRSDKSSGFSSFSPPPQDLLKNSNNFTSNEFISPGKTRSRSSKCYSRCLVQRKTSRVRVGFRYYNFSKYKRKVWTSRYRPLCHKPKCKTSCVHKPLLRREGSFNRSSSSRPLSVVKNVSLSPGEIDSQIVTSNSQVQEQSSYGCSELEEPIMVPSVEKVSTGCQFSPRIFSNSTDKGRSNKALTARILQSSRVDFLRFCLKSIDKYSSVMANCIVHSVRNSSLSQYQLVWERFQKYLKKAKSTRLTFNRVLMFFKDLFDSGLSPKTILRYRSALVWPLKYFNLDLLQRNGKRLFSHLAIERPPVLKVPPQWSLDRVLKLFQSSNFKNNETCDIKNLLYKTLFLFALAAGSRISEVHALSRDPNFLIFYTDDSKVILRPNSKFLYKNQSMKRIPPPICIPALRNSESSFDTLCPLYCLKIYIKRTDYFDNPDKNLWMDPISQKPLKKARLTRLFCEIISKAHGKAINSNFHQARAIAASLAYQAGLKVSDILKRAFWASEMPFFNNYLLSLKCTVPCVALGKKIN